MTNEIIDGEVIERGLVVASPQPLTLYGTDDPQAIIERATAQAKVLARVIQQQRLWQQIGSKQYVLLEGWTTLGSLVGVFALPVWTRQVEDGWEARVEARTMRGDLIGAAEAECLRSEKNWKGRDDFALKSMAQTRAAGKALRLPLGFIMQLAGFDPTPAEEMPDYNASGIRGGEERPTPAQPRSGEAQPPKRPPVASGATQAQNGPEGPPGAPAASRPTAQRVSDFWGLLRSCGYTPVQVQGVAQERYGRIVTRLTLTELEEFEAELKALAQKAGV